MLRFRIIFYYEIKVRTARYPSEQNPKQILALPLPLTVALHIIFTSSIHFRIYVYNTQWV